MIARFFLVGCIVAMQVASAGDQRSELKLSRPIDADGGRGYVIFAAPHKRVLIFVKNGAVSTLDVSADFPFSVSLIESPTPRYRFVVMFEDRQKGAVTDSFGVTPENSVEQTDEETQKMLIESAAKGRAIGEKLGKEMRGEHH
jgi:hypothetical protein